VLTLALTNLMMILVAGGWEERVFKESHFEINCEERALLRGTGRCWFETLSGSCLRARFDKTFDVCYSD
jgi:hypothetical protein